jgi:protein TonB
MGNLFGDSGPKVKAAAVKKLVISSGVMAGNLILKTQPVYPPIAKAARVSGTVVLQATISKTGAIENLHVVSGPAMLQQSAQDAVRQWRYRPYLLNGEPVEVETTVNVIFTLGG